MVVLRDRRNLPAELLDRLGDSGIVQRGVRLEGRARPLELRRASTGALHLVGYATSWEQPYTVYGGPPWGWFETMAEGSWDRTIREQDDIRLLVNHEGVPIARTRSGTLTLTVDAVGLLVDAEVDASSPQVQPFASAMERGDIDQMSCAFEVLRQEWSPDFDTRRILEVKGWDVAVVTYPANDQTLALIGRDNAPAAAGDPPAAAASGRSLRQAEAEIARVRVGR